MHPSVDHQVVFYVDERAKITIYLLLIDYRIGLKKKNKQFLMKYNNLKIEDRRYHIVKKIHLNK
jgi:GTP-binding protein EngB required for normal cell division